MKKLTVLLCACFLFFCAQAQDKVVLKIDSVFYPEKVNLPFRKIIVADARFDQTKIGCVYNKMVAGFLTTKKRDAVFPDSLKYYLPFLIQNFSVLNGENDENLFILVKKFRIAENFMTSVQYTINNYLTLNLSVSFYAVKNNSYTKLFSIDDVMMDYVDIASDVKLSLQYNKNQRMAILTRMLYNIFAYNNWTKRPQVPVFTDSLVQLGLEKRFSLPVYQQQGPQGLYKTFTEFKNASPTITGITIKYKDNKIREVLDQNGNKVDMNNYWGLSDGRKNYFFFRNEFTELIPCDKSFRVLSYRNLSELRGNATIDENRKRFFRTDEYFDLDMDTGELFLEEVFGKSNLKDLNKQVSK